MIFRAHPFEFRFPRPILIMGVLNVTPDSFSDGGAFSDPRAAVEHALRLEAEGAEIIDIGGESTRPNAVPVAEEEELRRILPVIERLAGRLKTPISIDTHKPAVARAALAAGASIINDIATNRDDPEMWCLAAATGAGYVAMHMQGTPQTMQLHPTYADVVREVEGFFEDRMPRMAAAGVSLEQVILDVGIGFGKTYEHNLELLRHLKAFRRFERPLLLGVSRKSFLGRISGGADVGQRLPAALACACWAVQQGVRIVRTHDVTATLNAVRAMEVLAGGAAKWI